MFGAGRGIAAIEVHHDWFQQPGADHAAQYAFGNGGPVRQFLD